ncbi:MAG: LytTR family transcriptional regulator [Lachnospiraceae bacterium]|jgi:DNA-binding LytR/AlgR family response regulator|nr:LytTR family transcriptional regulator [Lachnospiraceae bacterium]
MKRELEKLEILRNVQTFNNLNCLLEEIIYENIFDYVIVDIEKNGIEHGLEFAQKVYQRQPLVKLIFVIEDGNDFIENLFLIYANIVGVYQKPVISKRFSGIIKKILEKNSSCSQKEKLVFRKKGEIYAIPLEEIIYIESSGHKVMVFTDTEKYCYYGKIDTIKESLTEVFFQCHKSYLINMDRIINIEKEAVTLSQGKRVPISQSKYRKTKDAYSQYYMNRKNRYIETRGGVIDKIGLRIIEEFKSHCKMKKQDFILQWLFILKV